MEYHYYIGEGSEADAVVANAIDKGTAVFHARKAVWAEYGADALILSSDGTGKVIGLGFKEKQTAPYLKGGVRMGNGYGYFPKKNSKSGKALALKLDDPALTFDASDYIIKQAKVGRAAIGKSDQSSGMSMYLSAAGIINGKLLIKIPDAPTNPENGCDPMPDLPAWLREVKESEWLAVQGK